MNYQSTSLLIYSASFTVIAAISLFVAFFGLNAPLFYYLVVGLVFSVWISLHLHRMAEKGVVYLIAEKTQWMVYVRGIPVQETRTPLKNPCFLSVTYMTTFFRRFLIIKLLMQATAIYLALQQTLELEPTDPPYLLLAVRVLAVVIICFLINKIWQTVKNMITLQRAEWLIEEIPREGFSYYQAYIIRNDKKSGNQILLPALAELLKV
ncbi:hypothetical protein [Yersinia similis]|uniref:Uncharacterized protein n=1 Tax=Yersinia similis TaxID=367190 RepID=A0A0T9NT55_9GAMM|nr:hypothetical protein [Yersinia similis]AHK19932.1 hypothetical protein BF17_11900 [Yersinia similis]CFQ51798.1 Uncharacterised protein [Yersinia similis]CNB36562.1 Uncharacterised protein [Yersinia similis]CNE52386.1 Uncharacterised protein [Yersinia similis]CNF42574.1 Uncharacterised protein [Yersinia similis]